MKSIEDWLNFFGLFAAESWMDVGCLVDWFFWWVMGGSPPMAPPKEANINKQTTLHSIQQRRRKVAQFVFAAVHLWLKEWKNKWMERMEDKQAAHQAVSSARQAHQFSLLFALPLREAKKKKRIEWKRERTQCANGAATLSATAKQPTQQSILFSREEKKKLICLCCFAGELKDIITVNRLHRN